MLMRTADLQARIMSHERTWRSAVRKSNHRNALRMLIEVGWSKPSCASREIST